MSRARHYGFVTYPHPGGCEDCRNERVCNFCGKDGIRIGHCTNGRCTACHQRECAPGGSTGYGHGYGPNSPTVFPTTL